MLRACVRACVRVCVCVCVCVCVSAGAATSWGLSEQIETARRRQDELDANVYSSIYDKSFNRAMPRSAYQLTRLATPRQMSLKMSRADRTLWDLLDQTPTRQPELLPAHSVTETNPALCQPRHPPASLYD